MLTIFLQDVFFSLFDSATQVTCYLIATCGALFANAYFLLSERSAGKPQRHPFRSRAIRGTLLCIVFAWSFWSFVSSFVSVEILGYGLPVLWFTYAFGNSTNLACTAMAILAFVRRLAETGVIHTVPGFAVKADAAAHALRAPFALAATVTGLWTAAYTVLYSVGFIDM